MALAITLPTVSEFAADIRAAHADAPGGTVPVEVAVEMATERLLHADALVALLNSARKLGVDFTAWKSAVTGEIVRTLTV